MLEIFKMVDYRRLNLFTFHATALFAWEDPNSGINLVDYLQLRGRFLASHSKFTELLLFMLLQCFHGRARPQAIPRTNLLLSISLRENKKKYSLLLWHGLQLQTEEESNWIHNLSFMGEVQAESKITDFQQIDTIKSHQIGRDKQGSKWRLRRSQPLGLANV